MFATNSDLSREASRAAWRARTSTSMLCTTSTTPATAPSASRQGWTVQRRKTRVPSSRSSASSGSLDHLAGEGPLEHLAVALRHRRPDLVRACGPPPTGRSVPEVAQPARAVREVAAARGRAWPWPPARGRRSAAAARARARSPAAASLRSVMLRATACRPAKRPSSLTSCARWPTHRSSPVAASASGTRSRCSGSPAGAGPRRSAGPARGSPGAPRRGRPARASSPPRAPSALLGRGVRVGEAALGVGAEDDVVGRLDELAEAGLARREPRGDGALAGKLPLPLAERAAGLGGAATQAQHPQGKEHGGDGQDGRESEARRHAVWRLLNGQQ